MWFCRIFFACFKRLFVLGVLLLIFSPTVRAEEISFATERGQVYFLDIFKDEILRTGRLSQYFKYEFTGDRFKFIDEDTDENKDPFLNLYSDNRPIRRYFTEVPASYDDKKIFEGHKVLNRDEFSNLYIGTGVRIANDPDGIRSIDDKVLLIESNGKYQFYDINKSVIENMQSLQFDHVGEFNHGKAIAQLNDEAVLLDTRGQILKNYGKKYGYLGNYQNGYILARDACLLGKNVYGYSAFPLISESFKHIYSNHAEWFSRKHGEWVAPANHSIDGFFLMDAEENIVLDGLYGRYVVDADYYYPGGDRDYTKLSLEVINQDITEEGYLLTVDQGAYLLDENGYFTSEHKYGVLNLTGETIVDFLYNGYDRFGKYTVMYLDCGFEVFDENFHKVIVFYSNDYNRTDIKFYPELDAFQFSLYGKHGVISGQGEILVPAEYQSIEVREDEFFVTSMSEDKMLQKGVYTKEGKEQIPCLYSAIEKYGELYVVAQSTAQNWVMGIVDENNNILLPMEYSIQTMYPHVSTYPSSHDPRFGLLAVKSLDTEKIRIYSVTERAFITETFDFVAQSDTIDDKIYYALTNDTRTILFDNYGNVTNLPDDCYFHEFRFSKNGEDIILHNGTNLYGPTYLYDVSNKKTTAFNNANLQEIQTERGLFRVVLIRLSDFEEEQDMVIYDEDFHSVFEKKNVRFNMINDTETGVVKFSVLEGERCLYYDDSFDVVFYTENGKTYDWKGEILLDFPIHHMSTTPCKTLYSAGENDYRSDSDWMLVLDKAPSYDNNTRYTRCASILLGSPFINVNGQISYLEDLNFAFQPNIVNDTLWLGVSGMEKLLDCEIRVDYGTGNIRIIKDDIQVDLYINSNILRYGTKQIKLQQAPMKFDSFVALPAVEIAEMLGAKLTIQGDMYTFYYD